MTTNAVLAATAPAGTTPGAKAAPKRPTFFQARDLFQAVLRSGELVLSPTQNLVFRVLLENAVYDPRKHADDYGRVVESALGWENLTTLTGLGRTAVLEALKALAGKGLIRRIPRPILSGGSETELIFIEVPKVRETNLPEGTPDGPHEGTPDGPSSFIEKEANEETSSRRADARDDERTPSAQDQDQNQDQADYLTNRETLASWLGVANPASIGRNAVELGDRLCDEYGFDALEAAAQRCASEYKTSPVGLFVSSAESMCAEFAAEQQAQADAEGERAEREAQAAREAQERAEREHAALERAARKRQEQEQLRQDYADQFHGGSSIGAGRWVYNHTRHPSEELDFMRAALAQGTNDPDQMTLNQA